MRKTILELIRENGYKKISVSRLPYLEDSDYDLPLYLERYVIDRVVISDFIYSRNCAAYSGSHHISCSGYSEWVLSSVQESYYRDQFIDVIVRYPGYSWKVWPTPNTPGVWKNWPTANGKIQNLVYPFYGKPL